MHARVTRYEHLDFAPSDLARPVTTPEGFWKLDGKVARTGVQVYQTADGGTRRELRLEGDVKASLPGFALAPLTNGHPPRLVDPDNVKQYAAGAVGDASYKDGWVRAPITVWAKDAIDAIRDGRAQLSVGYSCRLVDEPGVHDGQEYDCRQTDITVNHLALVDVARAGPEARLRLDANDAIAMETNQGEPMSPKKATEAAAASATVKIDQAEYQVPAPLAAHLERMQAEIDVFKSSAQQTVVDEAAIKARADAATSERLAVIDRVRDHVSRHIELAKMDAVEIMRIGIAKLRPDLASKLDGKGREYVEVVFDAVVPRPGAAISLARASVIAPDIDAHGDDLDRDVDLSPKEKMDAAYDAQYYKNRPVVADEQPVKTPRVRVSADENLSPRERMLAMYGAAYFKNGKVAK